MSKFRTIKNEDADEVLFILREYLDVLGKAEKEFMECVEKGRKKFPDIDVLANPIQMANDMRIRKIQKAIEIMTFGSEE